MSNYKIRMDWVESKRINNVGIVKLNHQNPLNPLSAGFVEAIYTSCKKFDEDKTIKCIVVIGSEKAFAAGADLKEMLPLSYAEVSETRYIEKNCSYFSLIQTSVLFHL